MDYYDDFKCILIGNGSVGKTCLMLRFTNQQFRVSHINTIGIDVGVKVFNFQGRNWKIKIWDTAGQEVYQKALPRDMLHRLNGALIVYDVTNRKSFEDTQKWMKIIEDNAPKDTAIILVANKCDQPIAVSESDGRSLADFYKIPFISTSAKMGDNVEAAFEEMIKVAMLKNSSLIGRNIENRVTLEKDDRIRKKKCC